MVSYSYEFDYHLQSEMDTFASETLTQILLVDGKLEVEDIFGSKKENFIRKQITEHMDSKITYGGVLFSGHFTLNKMKFY